MKKRYLAILVPLLVSIVLLVSFFAGTMTASAAPAPVSSVTVGDVTLNASNPTTDGASFSNGILTLTQDASVGAISASGGTLTVYVNGNNTVTNSAGNGISMTSGTLNIKGSGTLNIVVSGNGIHGVASSADLAVSISENVNVSIQNASRGVYIDAQTAGRNLSFALTDAATLDICTSGVPFYILGNQKAMNSTVKLTSTGVSNFERTAENSVFLIEKSRNTVVEIKNGTYNMEQAAVGQNGNAAVRFDSYAGIPYDNSTQIDVTIEDATLNVTVAEGSSKETATYAQGLQISGFSGSEMNIIGTSKVNVSLNSTTVPGYGFAVIGADVHVKDSAELNVVSTGHTEGKALYFEDACDEMLLLHGGTVILEGPAVSNVKAINAAAGISADRVAVFAKDGTALAPASVDVTAIGYAKIVVSEPAPTPVEGAVRAVSVGGVTLDSATTSTTNASFDPITGTLTLTGDVGAISASGGKLIINVDEPSTVSGSGATNALRMVDGEVEICGDSKLTATAGSDSYVIKIIASQADKTVGLTLSGDASLDVITAKVALHISGELNPGTTASLILNTSGSSNLTRQGGNAAVLLEKADNINCYVKNGTHNVSVTGAGNNHNRTFRLGNHDASVKNTVNEKITFHISGGSLTVSGKGGTSAAVGTKTEYSGIVGLDGGEGSTMTVSGGQLTVTANNASYDVAAIYFENVAVALNGGIVTAQAAGNGKAFYGDTDLSSGATLALGEGMMAIASSGNSLIAAEDLLTVSYAKVEKERTLPPASVTVAGVVLNATNPTTTNASYDPSTGILTLTGNISGAISAADGKLIIRVDQDVTLSQNILMLDGEVEICGDGSLTMNGTNQTYMINIYATKANSLVGLTVSGNASVDVTTSKVPLHISGELYDGTTAYLVLDTTGTTNFTRSANNAAVLIEKAEQLNVEVKKGTHNVSVTGVSNNHNSPFRIGNHDAAVKTSIEETIRFVLSGGSLTVSGKGGTSAAVGTKTEYSAILRLDGGAGSTMTVNGGQLTVTANNATYAVAAVYFENVAVALNGGVVTAQAGGNGKAFYADTDISTGANLSVAEELSAVASDGVTAVEKSDLLTVSYAKVLKIVTPPASSVTVAGVELNATNASTRNAFFDASTGVLTLTGDINGSISSANGKLIIRVDQEVSLAQNILMLDGEVEICGNGKLIMNGINVTYMIDIYATKANSRVGLAVTGNASLDVTTSKVPLHISGEMHDGTVAYLMLDTAGSTNFTRAANNAAILIEKADKLDVDVKRGNHNVSVTGVSNNHNSPFRIGNHDANVKASMDEKIDFVISGGTLTVSGKGGSSAAVGSKTEYSAILRLDGGAGSTMTVTDGVLVVRAYNTGYNVAAIYYENVAISLNGGTVIAEAAKSGKAFYADTDLSDGAVLSFGEGTTHTAVSINGSAITDANLGSASYASIEVIPAVVTDAPADVAVIVTMTNGTVYNALVTPTISAGSGTITYDAENGVLILRKATGVKSIEIIGDMTVKVLGQNTIVSGSSKAIFAQNGTLTFIGDGRLTLTTTGNVALYSRAQTHDATIRIAQNVKMVIQSTGMGIQLEAVNSDRSVCYELLDVASVRVTSTGVPLYLKGAQYSKKNTLIMTSSGTATFERTSKYAVVFLEKAEETTVVIKNGIYNVKTAVAGLDANAAFRVEGCAADGMGSQIDFTVEDAVVNVSAAYAPASETSNNVDLRALSLVGSSGSTMKILGDSVVSVTATSSKDSLAVYGVYNSGVAVSVEDTAVLNVTASSTNGEGYAIYIPENTSGSLTVLDEGSVNLTGTTGASNSASVPSETEN